MALTQTRRSISVRGVTYDSLRRYSDQNDRSMSDIVEELLAGFLGKAKPERAPRTVKAPTAKVTPISAAKKAAKPVPAHSVKTAPQKAVAAKTVKAPLPARETQSEGPVKSGTVGRPAPTAAAVALSNTRRGSAGKSDYRGIRF